MSHQYFCKYLKLPLQLLWRGGGLTIGASLLAMSFGVLPALAEKLSDWRYDSQTRSLTLTLPSDITPTLSVVSDSQLLIEIPGTQVGNAIGQTVFDGVVESVVVEQADPDTVWMTVDFAPGTVLSNTQNATQIAVANPNPDIKQWQVRPALLASQVVESSVSAVESDAASPAAALRTDRSTAAISSSDAIAAVSDFPDLPVLEPAISDSGPVIVPPIDVRSPTPRPVAPPPPMASRPPAQVIPVLFPPIVEADAARDSEAESVAIAQPPAPPIVEVPVIEAPIVEIPVIEAPIVEEVAVEEPLAEDIVEPPFIGEIEVEVVNAPAVEPTVVSVAPASEVAASEIELPEAGTSDIEIPEIEISPVTNSRATSRWPEPIPFGQPLP